MFLTFHAVVFAWIFFRAARLSPTAFDIIARIFTRPGPLFSDPMLAQGLFGIAVVLALDVFHRTTTFWDRPATYSLAFRFAYALTLLFGIVLLGVEHGTQFIYFQF